MLRTNRYVTAGISVAIALSIGFVMQGGLSGMLGTGTPVRQDVSGATMVPVGPAMTPEAATEDPLDITGITRTASSPSPRDSQPPSRPAPPAPETRAAMDADGTGDGAPLPERRAEPGFACPVEMTATPQPAARVALHLSASCLGNQRLTIHHNGLMFTAATDGSGVLDVTVPALAEQAVFIASFDSGEGAVAVTPVQDLGRYVRVALQWQGASGVELHALEYDLDYGGPGHVWSAAGRDADAAIAGEGGFLTRLGEADMAEALQAEVYTFPVAAATRTGDVALNVETEVTEGNCGKELTVQALEVRPGQAQSVYDIDLFIPDCDSVGDYLVLKNIFEDLKIAAN